MRKTVKLAIAIAWICILLGIVCVGAATVAVGFDFEKLNTTEMIQGEFTIAGDFSEIDIHSLSADVRLMLAEDDICRVEYETRSDVSWKIAHGKLFVETEKSDPIVHIGIGFFNEHVNIYLPKDTYESLTIDTTSGDVYVFPAFDVVKTVKISSSSGDISFIGTVSESLTAESTSGSVLIREPSRRRAVR